MEETSPESDRPPTTRPPLASGRLVVTIDGPAGTGKSTVARLLAERLGLDYLDTGAMYRAVAWLALERGVSPDDGDALDAMLADVVIDFDWTTEPHRLLVDGGDPGDALRGEAVNAIVSRVAAQGRVRARLVALQRRLGDAHPRLVTEGRDQGSVVFPDAAVRFFLDADADERARRRAEQMRAEGVSADVAAIRESIVARDRLDATRADGPLTRPEGAIVIDTSDLSLEQVVARLEEAARRAVAGEFDVENGSIRDSRS